jgi:6,7-dimethyl-8-ribityllumazine synthase
MNKVLIVHTSWYADYINEMIKLSCKVLSENKFSWDISLAPGSIELPALAKHKLIKNKGDYVGILFLGIVLRGETTHYELVTSETFRSIGNLAMDYPQISVINNVICVENENQLKERLFNTENNTKSLIKLIHEKSS